MIMKRKSILVCAMIGLWSLSLQVYGQTTAGLDLYQQANALLRKGNADDARKAINLFNQAKKANSNLRRDCDERIQKCQSIIQKTNQVSLELSNEVVEIPWWGSDYQVGVMSSGNWNIEGLQDWLKTKQKTKSSFVLDCRNENNSTRERVSNLTVKNGNLYRSLKVVQKGRPEYIEVGAKSLSFPSEGSTEEVNVRSNARWDVRDVPSWCRVEKHDSLILIITSANDRVVSREDDIVIYSPNESVTIKIIQGAGEERLSVSQNEVVLPALGGKHYMRVYTDADNWFVGDFPSWINVHRVGSDSICIESGKNIPNGRERVGSVQVKTDRQTIGVMVTQASREAVDIIFPESKIVSGRNFSFGINASYAMPFVNTSAGGDFVGSVLDYSMGNSNENASYKLKTGFSFGLFADIRLYKNIFLIAGANFTQVNYKNEFDQPTEFTMQHNAFQYLKGDVTNSYKEEYSHSMLEVPILASYRFKLNNVSHIQLNLGPVLNFGMASKMKLRGNTDSNNLKVYNSYTHTIANNADQPHHVAMTGDFNLYQPCVAWTESYTDGSKEDINHHVTFTKSPMHRFNVGLRAGAAYEVAGISFGIYYTMMLSNMANKGYWEDKRWAVLNESNQVMSGYKHRIHTLEFKLAYTMRYWGQKNNK